MPCGARATTTTSPGTSRSTSGDGTLLCNPWLLTWQELRPRAGHRASTSTGGSWRASGPCPWASRCTSQLHKLRHDVGWSVHNHPLFGTVWADMGEVPPILDQSSALGGGRLVLRRRVRGSGQRRLDARGGRSRPWGTATMALLAGHGVLRPRRVGTGGTPTCRGPRATLPARLAGARRREHGALESSPGLPRPGGAGQRRGLHRFLGGGRASRAASRSQPAGLRPSVPVAGYFLL